MLTIDTFFEEKNRFNYALRHIHEHSDFSLSYNILKYMNKKWAFLLNILKNTHKNKKIQKNFAGLGWTLVTPIQGGT